MSSLRHGGYIIGSKNIIIDDESGFREKYQKNISSSKLKQFSKKDMKKMFKKIDRIIKNSKSKEKFIIIDSLKD